MLRTLRSARDRDLVALAFDVRAAWHELGCEVIDTDHARLVVNHNAPRIYDANLATRVRAATGAHAEAFLAAADDVYSFCRHRQVMIDPATPPVVEAQLSLAGFEADHWVELLLSSDDHLDGTDADIRPVRNADDWRSLARLLRRDHIEEVTKGETGMLDLDVTEQMLAVKRAKAPDVQFFLARNDGVDAAFFSSWPGRDGMGIVEDLFCDPDHRHNGLARALLAHCVADARERGAREVLIAADPKDWPQRFYSRMGFQPLAVARAWLLTEHD